MSGGEAARAALAAILLSRVDVLLLDEPTNNLDFAGLDLLEAFVVGFAGAVVVVSHDRAFLDRVVDRIVELDEHTHQAREFAGGWTAYTAARDLARSSSTRPTTATSAERDRLRDRQRTQQQWSERGVQPGQDVGRAGQERPGGQRGPAARSRPARSRRPSGKLDQLEVVDKPWEGWRLQLAWRPPPAAATWWPASTRR